jgi:hypothetical protein
MMPPVVGCTLVVTQRMPADKRRLTRMLSLVLISTALLAQTPSPKLVQRIEPAAMVFPVAGAPLSVEIVEERTTKLANGTSKTEVLTSKIYRDGAGRMRTETEVAGANGESMVIVSLLNRPDGFMAILVPAEKGGGRLPLSKKQQSEGGFGFPATGPLITESGKKTSKSESLGKQTIEGIEFKGTRTTTAVDGQPLIVGIEDQWASGELGLCGLMKSSGPDLEITAKIRNLDRHEPDPTLFTPPPDYNIRDLNPHDPAQ